MDPWRRHQAVLGELCRKVAAKGNTVPDAYLAAPAIGHGCEWDTTDRWFARSPGPRRRHPPDHRPAREGGPPQTGEVGAI